MQAVAAGYGVPERRELTGEVEAEGYVKEFTRHSNDVLLNLNELRRRDILTDATLLVGTARLRAHCAVLVACSGFFYSLFSRRLLNAGGGEHGVSLTLPEGLDAGSVSLLLDFMYTSRLPLTPRTVPGVLTAATYLQMEHVADTCRAFLQQRGWNAAPPPQRELNAGPHTVSMAPPSSWIRPPTARGEDFNKRTTRALGESWASLEPEACLSPMTGSQSLKTEEPELPAQAPTTPSPRSPSQSTCQPNSPAESSTSKLMPQLMSQSGAQPTPNPKACNWKKYKYIILNPLCATSIKEEGPGEGYQECDPVSSTTDRMDLSAQPANQVWSKEVPGYVKRHDQDPPCSTLHPKPPPTPLHGPLPHPPTALSQEDRATYLIYPPPCPPALDMAKQTSSPLCKPNPVKCESQCSMFCYPENQSGAKSVCPGEKPYRCNVCGAQFNRPANLKTHSRIHSGEKPYRCDTCGARFVQVAHLRAHVLIHTGEKPYPCHTCGTRFRHLQTLKSHLRIHTGEKPYSCEKCDLHFRHKSQLRLHLRQKHGAITNTKIRYKVLSEPYRAGPPVLQAC